MKNLFLLATFFFLFTSWSMAQGEPDYSCVGFAAMNGGTTGGLGAPVVRVTNYDEFVAAVAKKEKDPTPIYVEVAGLIEYPGGAKVEIYSNTTIKGVGTSGKFSQISLYVKNATNVIIQNISMTAIGSKLGGESDLISIATTSSGKCSNIWIDHCEFYNETPIRNPSNSLKDKYDGLIDIKKTSEYITVSWCYFHDHYKAVLIGYTPTDTYDRKITMHHNLFERVNSRTPSLRGGSSHIYNNVYIGTEDENGWFGSGPNLRENSTSRIEGNVFYGMSNTIYHADTKAPGTFSGDDNYIYPNSSPVITSMYDADAFNPPYEYALDKSADIEALLVPGKTVGVGVVDDEVVIINKMPVVDILTPVEGAQYDITEGGQEVEVTATASDEDGTVVKVEFFCDGTLVGEATQAPYSCKFNISDFKVYTLSARAYDNDNGIGYSSFVTIKGVKVEDGVVIEPDEEDPGDGDGNGEVIPGELLLSDDFTAGSTQGGIWVSSNSAITAEDPGKWSSGTDKGISGYFKVKKAVILPELPSCGKMELYMRASNARDLYIEKNNNGTWETVLTVNVYALELFEFTETVASLEPVQYRLTAENDVYLYSIAVYAGEEPDEPVFIETPSADKKVVATSYYNLSGMLVKELQPNAVYIRIDIYEDGLVERNKVLMKY